MKITKMSEKQKKILAFAFSDKYDNIICDGAVRTGKTVFMCAGFILWAMKNFNNKNFGICGKTVQSTERNIINTLADNEFLSFAKMKYLSSKHKLEVYAFGKKNTFYVFGGRDESSYTLIQGVTLAGVFFDEVALQPKSFVEQGIARTLTEPNAKLWFNCNPEHPEHWFYKEWILDADGKNEKNTFHLHFLLPDNPILTAEAIEKAESLYTGVFKERYIYGKWVVTDGLVYPHYSNTVEVKDYYDKIHDKFYVVMDGKRYFGEYYISIDYGTHNPFSAGLWFVSGDKAIRVKEYYYDSVTEGAQQTDDEYFKALKKFIGRRPIEKIVVDPSAASFITLLNKKGFRVQRAKNDVVDGIRIVSAFLVDRSVLIGSRCKDAIREFSLYSWDDKANADKVIKAYDHALDDIRYFCTTILRYKAPFSKTATLAVENNAIIDEILNDWS